MGMTLNRIEREMQVEIRMSLIEFVQLAQWMNNHIKRLEEAGVLGKAETHPTKQLDYNV